jgi:hypothetical protein
MKMLNYHVTSTDEIKTPQRGQQCFSLFTREAKKALFSTTSIKIISPEISKKNVPHNTFSPTKEFQGELGFRDSPII